MSMALPYEAGSVAARIGPDAHTMLAGTECDAVKQPAINPAAHRPGDGLSSNAAVWLAVKRALRTRLGGNV
jgi:hypothetical protein